MSSSKFEYPNINVGGKSNEQNMQAVKSHLINMSDQLNFYISNIEAEIEDLKAQIKNK